MWLTCSSVGRKFIMAVTGACLVLFVTFHCLMNAIAICWPTAYNQVCEFLGANWYALVASAGLALLFIIHIVSAVWLTLQNRKARGSERYLISKRPKTVEWSSKNMLVLGIVVLAFLVVHLIQFWAKMQLVEICGVEGTLPPTAGTLFIQEAFSQIWTPIVYIIGFVALWFHMTHGFWSMFQSVGWDNTAWIPRLRKIGCCWTTIVIALFVVQAIVFTVKAQEDYYKTDPQLRDQYIGMVAESLVPLFGPQVKEANFEELEQNLPQVAEQLPKQIEMVQANPTQVPPGQLEKMVEVNEAVQKIVAFLEYLNGGEPAENENL